MISKSHFVPLAIVWGLLAIAPAARAEPRPAAPARPGCEAFIDRASRHYRIPAGILLGVAMVESNFRLRPHPWTVAFLDGAPSVYAESFEAVLPYLRQPDGQPRRDISIGCMQLNMAWHLQRVGTPELAIDPERNVWYAAQLLRRLYDRRGAWTAAVIDYNGDPDPERRVRYACAVDGWMRRMYRLPHSPQRQRWCGAAAQPGVRNRPSTEAR